MAKSNGLYKLSEIFAMFSGFSFVVAGIFYNGSIQMNNAGMQLQNDMMLSTVQIQLDLSFNCIGIGLIFAILSFVVWSMGYRKDKKVF